jgi:hypothetical protein
LKPGRQAAEVKANFTCVLTRRWHSLSMLVHPFQLRISATAQALFAKFAKTRLNLTVPEATGQ